MSVIKTFGLFIVTALIVLAFLSMYTVTQGHAALLLRLGKIIDNPETNTAYVMQPGLHFKTPFLNQVRHFDMRLQTLTEQSSRIMTAEQKYVLVDYYVKWRIKDLPLFYTRTGGFAERAGTLLRQQINDALRAAFGQRTITEVISDERASIMNLLKERANKSAETLGISIIDVRIKSIDLPQEVSHSVFSRMSTKREQVAAEHRADGRAKAEGIRADADAKSTVIVATAKEKAAKVRAAGEAKAADIYATAYTKNREFYEFYRSLIAYVQTFNKKKDILVVRPDSTFFKYFNSSTGK